MGEPGEESKPRHAGPNAASARRLPLRARMRRVVDLREVLEIEMRVDLRRRDIRVAEQLLHGTKVTRRFEQMARTRMPHQVRIDALPDALLLRTLLEPRAHAVRRQRLAAAAAYERVAMRWSQTG